MRVTWIGLLALGLFWGMGNAIVAHPHPQIGYNLRAVHFEHHPDAMTAYFRLTLPLVVANRLGARRADGTFTPAPYTYNKLESGQVFHYLDISAVRNDVLGLGKLVAAGHEVAVKSRIIAPKVVSVRVHPKGHVPPFSTLAEAKAAAGGAAYPPIDDEIDSGYVLVDVVLRYAVSGGIEAFSIRSTLVPGELGEPLTRNVFWVHRNGVATEYGAEGLLDRPFAVEPARTATKN